jgi:3-hydroxy acid dehydrogenase/malonic semialdehyde reductase
MGSLKDAIVFVTGASSGIGISCARAFAACGARLILAARRRDRLQRLAAELETGCKTAVHVIALDVREQASVERAVAALSRDWRSVEVLVNNAGLSRGLNKLHEGTIGDWEEMIDTNIKGLLYVSRAVIPGMAERGRGHIINIGSVAGREVYPGGNVYCATKAAVRALSQSLRIDLLDTGLRVTNIDPGMVETEFSIVRFHGDRERADKVYKGLQPLTPDDIAELAVFCATRPPHVNISDVLIMPTAQASATFVHREQDKG